jgi:chromosome segregation ATPase
MSKIDELNKEIEEKSDIVFRLRNDVVFYEDKINKVKEDLDMVQSKSIIITDDLNKQINSLSKLLKSKQEDYDYLMKNLEMIGSSINLARAELTKIESNIDVSIDKYAESMKEYNLLKSKLD